MNKKNNNLDICILFKTQELIQDAFEIESKILYSYRKIFIDLINLILINKINN